MIEILCRDRLLKVFCHDREFSVATENPKIWDFPCRDSAQPRHAATECLERETVIFGLVLQQKLCVVTGFKAGTGCLGHDKGPLMS